MGKRSSKDEVFGRILQRRLLLFVLVSFAVLFFRLVFLQIMMHEHYEGSAENNVLHRERIAAPRGIIEDAKGKVLVDNVPTFDIAVPWEKEARMLRSIRKVINFFSLDSTTVFSNYDQWKKKNAGLDFPVIRDADKIVISAVCENNDIFRSLRVQTKARRRYRFGSMAAHILGYVGEVTNENIESTGEGGYRLGDMIGKMGLEKICEDYLKGRDGRRVVQMDVNKVVIDELPDLLDPPVPGRRIRLTIDAELQAYLEELLSRWDRSAAVVMNINDGAIIAAASMPQFDPNSFAKGISKAEWDSLFNESKKPLFGRFFQATYPPGSTFKVISAFAALEYEIASTREVLTYCTGAHRFGNRIYRCWKSAGHGYMNMYTALVQSCDSYFFKLGESIDVDELARAARAFGLGEKTGIEFGNESAGLVPDRTYYNKRFGKGKWTQGYVLNNVIGQGEYLVTVLQMCRVAAALANGGYLVTPHVIARIEGVRSRAFPRKKVEGLSGSTLAFLQKSMRGAVNDPKGTAYAVRDAGIIFAGKTGTAQNPHGEDHAWFISYAPADKPEIAMAVIIENAGHGGSIAAPVVRDFYRRYFFGNSSETVLNNVSNVKSDKVSGKSMGEL